MNRLIQYSIVFISVLFVTGGVNAQEYRLGVSYEREVLKKLEFETGAEIRSIQREKKYYNGLLQGGMSYEFLDGLSLGATARYTLGENEENRDDEDYTGDYSGKWRLTGDLKYKTIRFDNDLRIKQRLRIQQVLEDAENEWEYYLRYKIGIDYRLTKDVTPYIALEPYYSFEKEKIKTVRLESGCQFEVLGNDLDLFVIIEAIHKKHGLTSNYIIGVSYKF